MKLLELFAGSRSMGKIAEGAGIDVFSVDIKDFKGIDLVKDIEFLTKKDIPFEPNFIWASPPCTSYSIAGISSNRNEDTSPKSEFAEKSDRIIKNLLRLINSYRCNYYIENPVGMLRKMDFMKGLNRTTITYCSYGDTRMKPTDVWSNNIYDMFNLEGWMPRAMCFNGNKKCHHEPAPRGSKTGTQGLKNNYERSKLPEDLCYDIVNAEIRKYQKSIVYEK
jgi:site-specific DNA-cytosine methylase